MVKHKKRIIISVIALLAAVYLCLYWYARMNFEARSLTELSNWQSCITYSMLSDRLKSVVSEEEFNDHSDAGRYNMYRKLESLEPVAVDKNDFSTGWWKSPPFDCVETDEGSFFIEYQIDFKVRLNRVEVVNFIPYFHEEN